MICPKCKSNLEGDLIYETFLKQFNGDKVKALEVADSYGATEKTGRWGREIGIYSMEEDRTTGFTCPDCSHQWSRLK